MSTQFAGLVYEVIPTTDEKILAIDDILAQD